MDGPWAAEVPWPSSRRSAGADGCSGPLWVGPRSLCRERAGEHPASDRAPSHGPPDHGRRSSCAPRAAGTMLRNYGPSTPSRCSLRMSPTAPSSADLWPRSPDVGCSPRDPGADNAQRRCRSGVPTSGPALVAWVLSDTETCSSASPIARFDGSASARSPSEMMPTSSSPFITSSRRIL